jgi:hypothetical protein
MLLAEIHGKVLEEARNHEDYLTSAVFGHLRYLPPCLFWDEFFSNAKTVAIEGKEKSLCQSAREQGARVSEYSALQIHFWPNHPKWGQPDLVLCFTGTNLPPLVIVIEVKLYSEKSGTGDDDQLGRYLGILGDLSALDVSLPVNPLAALVYLTPRESLHEIESTLASSRASPADRQRLFRVQWQDLLAAARRAVAGAEGQSRTILQDVCLFLEKKGLEYFSGFAEDPSLPMFAANDGTFYMRGSSFAGFKEVAGLEPGQGDGAFYERHGFFAGFREVAGLGPIQIEKGGWNQ